MCVVCSDIPPIPSNQVPIKFMLSAMEERRSIELLGEEVTRVTWYYAYASYIASFVVEYGPQDKRQEDVVNFSYSVRF